MGDDSDVEFHCIEMFAGSKHLTKGINSYPTMQCLPLDKFTISKHHDVNGKYIQRLIKDAADEGFLDYLHMAIPCETHSQARYPRLRTRCHDMIVAHAHGQ